MKNEIWNEILNVWICHVKWLKLWFGLKFEIKFVMWIWIFEWNWWNGLCNYDVEKNVKKLPSAPNKSLAHNLESGLKYSLENWLKSLVKMTWKTWLQNDLNLSKKTWLKMAQNRLESSKVGLNKRLENFKENRLSLIWNQLKI